VLHVAEEVWRQNIGKENNFLFVSPRWMEDKRTAAPGKPVVWRPRAAGGAARRSGRRPGAGRPQASDSPKIKKLKNQKKEGGGSCQEGCCDSAADGQAGTAGGAHQGQSYLRRYGMLRLGGAMPAKAVEGDEGEDVELKPMQPASATCGVGGDSRTCAMGLGDCCKGKERDPLEGAGLEKGGSSLSEATCRWGVEMSCKAVDAEVVMSAVTKLAVECCRLCWEADECCRQLCCAALCCVRELQATLIDGRVGPSKDHAAKKVPPSDPRTPLHCQLAG
jgi:hypothetical protein